MPTKNPGQCKNCSGFGRLARGRCMACYEYLRRHGEERQPRFWIAGCSNCGEEDEKYIKGRCRRCYDYWLHHKKERPKRWWSRFYCEGGCGKMLVRGRDYICRGRCQQCYDRLRRHGIKKVTNCECGNPAKHFPQTHGYGTELPLCDSCYEEYLEMEGMS